MLACSRENYHYLVRAQMRSDRKTFLLETAIAVLILGPKLGDWIC